MSIQPDNLPPTIAVPKVAAAAEELVKFHDEHRAAVEKVYDLEQRRHEAVEADSAAYARAIRAAKPDPGQKITEKHDAELAASRRRWDALAKARASAEADFVAAVQKHRGEWLAQLEQERTEAEDGYAAALDALEVARNHLVQVRGTIGWLDRFPGRVMWKGVAPAVGLENRHGEPTPWPTVVEALRAEAAPPPPSSPPEVRPLRPIGGAAA